MTDSLTAKGVLVVAVVMTQLQGLGLAETKVTDAGIAGLKKALPNCRIYG